MGIRRILVANRGEIAIRILRAAAELGIATVAVYSADDAALPARRARRRGARARAARGAAAYLDIDAVDRRGARSTAATPCIRATASSARTPRFADRLRRRRHRLRRADAGAARAVRRQGRARATSPRRSGVPVPARHSRARSSRTRRRALLRQRSAGGAMMIKAVAGGGGRGMRVVRTRRRARRGLRALPVGGAGRVRHARRLRRATAPRARHIEVQIVGDGTVASAHLGERECSLQRRHQKLIEIAPSPALSARAARSDSSTRRCGWPRPRTTAASARFEFLVDAAAGGDARVVLHRGQRAPAGRAHRHRGSHRLDLVQTQLRIADGATLGDLGLDARRVPAPRGFAHPGCASTWRRIDRDGDVAAGRRHARGVRAADRARACASTRSATPATRTQPALRFAARQGDRARPSADFADVLARARRALGEFRDRGRRRPTSRSCARCSRSPTSSPTASRRASSRPRRRARRRAATAQPQRSSRRRRAARHRARRRARRQPRSARGADARQDRTTARRGRRRPPTKPVPDGSIALRAPLQGTVVAIDVAAGDAVRKGQQLLVMEAMKMEHVIAAPASGIVQSLAVARGDTVFEGRLLVLLDAPATRSATRIERGRGVDLDRDPPRPRRGARAPRHRPGRAPPRRGRAPRANRPAHRAREHRRPRRPRLLRRVRRARGRRAAPAADARGPDPQARPADGLVAGIGSVNGDLFGAERARAAR